jgi:hypothetical protein
MQFVISHECSVGGPRLPIENRIECHTLELMKTSSSLSTRRTSS